jgi:cyclic pyranopterin phosphate synthase
LTGRKKIKKMATSDLRRRRGSTAAIQGPGFGPERIGPAEFRFDLNRVGTLGRRRYNGKDARMRSNLGDWPPPRFFAENKWNEAAVLSDDFNRNIDYLRVSITDRCNLRCVYCMPEGVVDKLDHQSILTYEELERIIDVAVGIGIGKIRLTGGEPLVRKGVTEFVARLIRKHPKLNLRMTTNGVLLADMAAGLVEAGLSRVNISLDSMDEDVFARITGRPFLKKVLKGIDAALSAGFRRVKINCVPVRGINEDEIKDFAALTLDRPLDVRFIEYMPLGKEEAWSPDKVISTDEAAEKVAELGELTPEPVESSEGPAVVYRLKDAVGRIGFISPLTRHFCRTCNRIRLTADGHLRPCLLSNGDVDIKTALRRGGDDEELAAIVRRAVREKPGGHFINEDFHSTSERSMHMIGG